MHPAQPTFCAQVATAVAGMQKPTIAMAASGEIIALNHAVRQTLGFDYVDLSQGCLALLTDDKQAQDLLKSALDRPGVPLSCVITAADGSRHNAQLLTTQSTLASQTLLLLRLASETSLWPDRAALTDRLLSDLNHEQWLELSLGMVCLADRHGRLLSGNSQWQATLGYALDELQDMSILELVHPQDRQPLMRILDRIRNHEDIVDALCRCRHKDGGYRWLEWRARSLGSMIHASARDVTARVQMQQDMNRTTSGLDAILRTVGDMCFVLDMDGTVVHVNETTIERLGYSRDEIVGQPVSLLHPAERRDQARRVIAEMLNGTRGSCTIPVQACDGSLIPVETRIALGAWEEEPVIFGVARDVSELERSEQKFHSVFEASPVLMAITTDVDDMLVDVNLAFVQALGYTRAEILGHPFRELGILANEKDLAALYQPPRRIGGHRGKRVTLRGKDGHVLSGIFSADPVELGQGPAKLITFTDMTASLRTQKALDRMSEDLRFRIAFEHAVSDISTSLVGADAAHLDRCINDALQVAGQLLDVDRCYVFLIDHDASTISNTHEWCHESAVPQIDALQNLPLDTFPWWMDRLHRGEHILVTRVDKMAPEASAEQAILAAQDIISVAVLPLVARDLGTIGFIGFDAVRESKAWYGDHVLMLRMMADALTTALQRTSHEREIEASRASYQALVDAVPDVLVRATRQGDVLDCSSNLDLAAFLWPQGSDGRNLLDLVAHARGDQRDRLLDELSRPGDEMSILPIEFSAAHAGIERVCEIRISPGEGDFVVAIIRDVTERAWLERKKTDFINTATHEIRTPLTTISLMVHLLEQGGSQEERDEYWRILKEELGRERQLVEDLLTAGRLEEHRVHLDLVAVSCGDALREMVQSVTPLAAQKAVSVNLHVPERDALTVMADHGALRQVLLNVLNNAVKFNRDGGRVDVTTDTDGSMLTVAVRDTGIGIPEQDLDNIGERFSRASNVMATAIGGSGIGLYLTKQLLEQMDGSLALSSVLDQGTTVTIALPLATEPELA